MADAFTAIKSGLYEGYPTSWSLGFAYKIYEAPPYLTKVNFGALAGTGLSFNKTMWNKLPAHAQAIMREVAAEWPIKYADIVVAKRERFEGMMKEKGAKVVDLPQGERKRWAQQLPNMAKDWAAEIDKKGQPGTKMLVAYMDGMRSTGADMVRHWDRE
jgi:TRAP-type C4-dicarboxylate transport system substrate-binding protein